MHLHGHVPVRLTFPAANRAVHSHRIPRAFGQIDTVHVSRHAFRPPSSTGSRATQSEAITVKTNLFQASQATSGEPADAFALARAAASAAYAASCGTSPT